MERPPNFKRIVGVVKKVDQNYYGIGDGAGNFAFLTKKFIVGMYPTNPIMWQKTIFLIENSYNIKWKPENEQYYNSYDYQTKTIEPPTPIPVEFLEGVPPPTPQRPMTQFHQPVPQQPAPTQQFIPQQPAPPPSVGMPAQGTVQTQPSDYIPQIIARLGDISQTLLDLKGLLDAIYKEMIYTKTPGIPSTMPPKQPDDGMRMEEFINKPVNPEKSDKKGVPPKIKW